MARKHSQKNLAARMGRWSAAHWKTATFGWLALVAVAFAVGGMVGTKQIDQNTQGPGESGRMDRILDAGFKRPAGESVLVQSEKLRTSDPAFRAAVADVIAGVKQIDDVQNVRSPFASGNAGQIAKNGRAVLVQFEIPGDSTEAMEKVVPVVDKVGEVQKAHLQFFIGEFGDASAPAGAEETAGKDLGKAGVLSLPITLIILAVTFGALI